VCSSLAIVFLKQSGLCSRRCALLGDWLRFVVGDHPEISGEKVAGDVAPGHVRDQFAVDS
jgi:hypothetical protein